MCSINIYYVKKRSMTKKVYKAPLYGKMIIKCINYAHKLDTSPESGVLKFSVASQNKQRLCP
jgi:hypothetical protein